LGVPQLFDISQRNVSKQHFIYQHVTSRQLEGYTEIIVQQYRQAVLAGEIQKLLPKRDP